MIEYRAITRPDVPAIMGMCRREGWTSFARDTEPTWAILTAPGVTTLVAVEEGKVLGFVQMQSDGLLQAHLSNILVVPERRRQGIGSQLIREAFARCGAERVDLVTETAPEFYRSFVHQEWFGFRLHPQ
jgi:ribosomal protein S18 acetylase RimI-like enzyme